MIELVVGGALFWIFVAVAFIAFEASVAYETHLGVLWTILLVAAFQLFSPYNPLGWMLLNPVTVLFWIAMYVAVGIIWAFIKWTFHGMNARDKIDKNIVSIKERYNTSSPGSYKSFNEFLTSNHYIPVPLQNKWLITVWAAWWPWSVLWTILNDVIRRMWDFIVTKYMWVFDAINKRLYGKYDTVKYEPKSKSSI